MLLLFITTRRGKNNNERVRAHTHATLFVKQIRGDRKNIIISRVVHLLHYHFARYRRRIFLDGTTRDGYIKEVA